MPLSRIKPKPKSEPTGSEEKPEMPLGNITKDILEIGKDVFKNPDTGKPPKVLEMAEKYEKYLPLIGNFMKGMLQGMQQSQQQQVQNTQQAAQPSVRPPAGWDSMSWMERLKRKYASDGSETTWWQHGEAWENYKKTGDFHYNTPSYQIAPANRQQAMNHNPSREPHNLQQLARKYPEPPLVDDTPIPPSVSQLDSQQAGISLQHNQAPATDTPKEQQSQTSNTPAPEEQLMKELNQDQITYVNMAIEYLQKMPMKDFKVNINNLDVYIKKGLSYKIFFPFQLKTMIRATTADELMIVLKERVPDKYTWLEKNKKIELVKEKYDVFRTQI